MKLYCIPVQYQIILNDIIFSSTFKNFHFIPFISPSPLCFYNCRTVGSIRPTFPLISIFGQKLYTRCLFSWSSPGRRLLYYFPVFRTQFFITCRPILYFKFSTTIKMVLFNIFCLHIIFKLFFFLERCYVLLYDAKRWHFPFYQCVYSWTMERFIFIDGDESGEQFVDTERTKG